jgi:hypothetical protein
MQKIAWRQPPLKIFDKNDFFKTVKNGTNFQKFFKKCSRDKLLGNVC